MISTRHICTIFMTAIMLTIWSSRATFAGSDPFIQIESDSKIEIDLQMVVDDLLPLALEAAAAESEEEAVWIQMLVEMLNIEALDRVLLESSITKEQGRTRAKISLLPGETEGLLPAMFSITPGEYRFGTYLADENVTFLVSLTNFAGFLSTMLDFLSDPQVRDMIPFLTVDEYGELDIFGIKPRQDILPLLDGELDLVMFPPPEDFEGDIPPFTLALGTTDGPALKDQILKILGQHASAEMAAELAAMPGEPAGEFLTYPLPDGVSYAVSPDFLVITSETERMAALLAEPDRSIEPVRALEYGRLDGDRLVEMFAAEAFEEAKEGTPEEQMKAELLEALGEEPVGMLEYWVTSDRPGTLDFEFTHPGAIMNVQYNMLKTMLAMAPKAKALQKERGRYQEILHYVDAAMTSYGEDHDGIFPEDPMDLVGAGYLDYFPELQPTPLGEYLEGGYTYVPLRDEEGAIVGYYFFIYGIDPNSGQDVFTAENLADPASFQVGRDGEADGVVHFCYDGIALDQVEVWRGEY